MTRNQIITEVKKNFTIQELVCREVYNKWGERAWQFLDTNLLEVLLVLRRDILQVPLVCNDWKFGGKNTQRGLRCNTCQLVKSKTAPYLSMHIFGKAVDLVSAKMTAEKMRKLIQEKSVKLPCNVRIEGGVNWLHIDVMDMGTKVYEFNG